MKLVVKNLLFALIIITYKSYTAQQYSFYNFDEGHGLSNSPALGIVQNNKGEVILGTYNGGIEVFNGITFKRLTKNEGLIDNFVYDVINIDSSTQLFTTSNGISLLENNYFKNYFFKDSLATTLVYTAIKNKKGKVWLATGNGLAYIENDSISSFKSGSEVLDNIPIIHIREGMNGELWCSTMGAGVFVLRPDQTFDNYMFERRLLYTFQTFQYDENTTWFLTYMGVFQLNNGKISKVEINCNEHLQGVYYHSCIRDSKNNIWLATLKGVIKIDKKGNEQLFTVENGLHSNDAWKVFEDREHNIWITFKSSGVSKLTNQFFVLKNNQLSDLNVQAIFIDSLNSIWIGSKRGVDYFKHTSMKSFRVGYATKDDIKTIAYFKNKYYFLSADGLNELNNLELRNINTKDNERFVGECIFVDQNKLFLGSSVTGVAEFKNNEILYINDSLGFPDKIGIFSMVKTRDNLWWYATDEGLFCHNGNNLTKQIMSNGVKADITRSLALDRFGKLWVGNSEGVFYREGEHFHSVYKGDQLHNNSIYSLCFDKEGNLWAGKIDGIDKIIIKEGKVESIRRFDTQKGLKIGSVHNNAMAVDSNGHILVGTDKGLLVINPYLDFPNKVENKTHIEEIRLFSQPTDWSEYADSLDADGFPVGLKLAYNQNYFTFNYMGICHKYPEGVRYQTKLVGLDKDWVDREDNRFVIYGNLKPGSYTFLLKSSNNEGIWNSEPVSFSFVITPPFWQTWWFYSICFAIFLGGVYSYVKIRNANYQITQKNEQITIINHQIEEKNHEIMDSINYAKRIQDSILPDSKLKYLLPKSFVYFQPKDVVSGDFYWLKNSEEELLFSAIDCTGHGVPGAFVSMVGFGGLNRAVNEYNLTEPGAILEKLSDFVVDSFAKHESKSINDGMDASLCALNKSTNVLQYAGANNAIYIIRASKKPLLDADGVAVETIQLDTLNEIKATRRPIGKTDNPVPFKNHTIQLEKDDSVYLFTDGFPDQFGGEKGKKYMYKTFKRFLISIQDLPIEEQGDRLKQEFESWAAGHEQVDDICILGVKI